MRKRTSTDHGENPGVARRWVVLALALALTTGTAAAQEAPFNASEVSQFDQAGQSYADVWGDGNFAYIAHFGQRVVDIIDITDPVNPALAATYDSLVGAASAQDVKVADGLMFVGLEGASPGCQIVDVRDPFAPVKLTDVTVLPGVHNVFYDQGWLYLVDSSQTIIEIVDLRTYDPNNPPAVISTSQWQMWGWRADRSRHHGPGRQTLRLRLGHHPRLRCHQRRERAAAAARHGAGCQRPRQLGNGRRTLPGGHRGAFRQRPDPVRDHRQRPLRDPGSP